VKTIPVETTYLEIRTPRAHARQTPLEGTQIIRAEKPTIGFYRFLYNAVGKDWDWVDRKLLGDDELAAIIHDERVEIYVLYVNGTPGGYAELDRRVGGEIELAYFGIMPEFLGNGLGRYFLHRIIEKAWSHGPNRLWVHTCELDHPAALPLYLQAGFDVFDRRTIDQPLPKT